jgi:hypothetical protein
MIEHSAAFAELHQWNLDAMGTGRAQDKLDLTVLLRLYAASIVKNSTAYELDVPSLELQSAWIADTERRYTRFIAQFATYCRAFETRTDLHWAAVTGYYAGFMGAAALLSAAGLAVRKIEDPIGPISKGRYAFEVRTSIYSGRSLLVVSRASSDSHRALWKTLVSRLKLLSLVTPTDVHTSHILDSLADLIQRPTWLSDFRNWINYSQDVNPADATLWASEIAPMARGRVIEDRIASVSALRDEQRVELVTLSCGSLVSALHRSYLRRADRPDRRPERWRAAHVRDLGQGEMFFALRSWLL